MNEDCTRYLDLLLDSLDEPLAPADRLAFDAHLARCPDCVVALKEHVVLRTTIQEIDQAPAALVPPALPEYLVARCVSAMRLERSAFEAGGRSGNARTA
ncbi:MAG TPA: zf-HC2 domain-containing protein [Planctomycetota bacterium]|jgi:anti-sigma factor RsiW|nr:zf-HC2 domain-containing protein [Planctomycetota bacterium]